MDITIINDAIKELESADTTIDNVSELANLYIVKNNFKVNDPVFDILPAYKNYCQIKRKYQMNELSDDSVIVAIKLLCQELQNFIQDLYCNTDMRKERAAIESVLSAQYNQFCKS